MNGLARRLALVRGSLDALGAGERFELVLANLLRRELEPLLPALAAALAPRGCAVLSGLLASERAALEPQLRALGLELAAERTASDPSGDAWLALVVRPRS